MDPDKVRKLLEPVLGYPDSSKPGGDHDYRCPFCVKAGRDKVSHLHVNYRKGKALCHGCEAGFLSLRSLVMAVLGRVPRSLNAHDGGAEFEEYVESLLFGSPEAGHEPAVHAPSLPAEFIPLVGKPADRQGAATLRYLVKERGVPMERLLEVGVGYCPSGPMGGYAIFPVHVGGRLVTYTSRRVPVLKMNGPKSRHGAFGRSASTALFNYDNCDGARRVFVGEGPFDAWAFHRRLHPRDVGVAVLGTILHKRHIRLIEALCPEEVVFCFDPDAIDKARKSAEMANSVGLVASFMSPEADPDELTDEQLSEAVDRRIVVGEEGEDLLLSETFRR